MIPFPPRQILVADDLTARSGRGWRFARSLADKTGASLNAVFVSPTHFPTEPGHTYPMLTPEERRAIEGRLRAQVGAGLARVAEGDVVVQILRAAKDCRAGLIITIPTRRTAMERFLLGSVTETLVRLSPVPVLALHESAELPRRVLAPINLQPYSMKGLHAAQAVAETLGAELTLLHVREHGSGARNNAQERLAAELSRSAARIEVRTKIDEGSPVERIVKEAAHHDLVVLVAHKRGIFRGGLLGSTAERVLRRSRAATLSVPAPMRTPPPSRRAAAGRRRQVEANRRRGRRTEARQWIRVSSLGSPRSGSSPRRRPPR